MALPPRRADAGAGAALTVLDYQSKFKTTAPGTASGILTATFDPVPPGLFWLIGRMTIVTTSITPTACAVYDGASTPQNLVDGSSSGNLDTADENSPILVESNNTLTVVWTGASVGAVGTVRVQYQLVQRG